MAQDIQITWTNPTQNTNNQPTTISKVRIYELQPGNPTPVLATEIVDPAIIAAQKFVLVGYYTAARPYTFEVSCFNTDGESALSPPGTDSYDVPKTPAAPGVLILPKP